MTVRLEGSDAPLPWVLREAGLAASTSEGGRLLTRGGVKVDGERVADAALSSPLDGQRSSRWDPGDSRV